MFRHHKCNLKQCVLKSVLKDLKAVLPVRQKKGEKEQNAEILFALCH